MRKTNILLKLPRDKAKLYTAQTVWMSALLAEGSLSAHSKEGQDDCQLSVCQPVGVCAGTYCELLPDQVSPKLRGNQIKAIDFYKTMDEIPN